MAGDDSGGSEGFVMADRRRASRSLWRAGVRWTVEHRLVLATGLVAAVPIMVSTVRALRGAWTPVLDDALIATNAFDVLGAGSRLVGVYSDASVPGHDPVFNLGPMVLWVLTLQTHLLGSWALPVTAGLINTGSVLGAVALALRRGGRVFMFATAAALAAMSASMPPETLHDIFNPWIVLFPLTLLLFLAWSVACAEYRLLPVTVLVASFVVQGHFSLGLPAVGALLVALGGLGISLARTRRPGAPAIGRDLKPWLLAALALAVVCWAPTLIDQAVHRPGNVVSVVRAATADDPNVPAIDGWHALSRALGVRPWWLRPPLTSPQRFFEVVGTPPRLAVGSCVLVLSALAIIALLGLRRRRPDVTAAAVLSLVVAASIVLVVAATPARLTFHIEKSTRWTSCAGMFIWLTLGWSVATLAYQRAPHAFRQLNGFAAGHRTALSILGLVLTLAVALAALRSEPDQFEATYRPVGTIVHRLEAAHISRERPVLVHSAGSFDRGFAVHLAIVYQLRRRGYDVVTSVPALGLPTKLGTAYSPERHHPHDAVFVDDRKRLASFPSARVIARIRMPGSSPRPLVVSLLPAAEVPLP
jgi:hypothetical protein